MEASQPAKIIVEETKAATQLTLKDVKIYDYKTSGPLHKNDTSYYYLMKSKYKELENEILLSKFEEERKKRNLSEEFRILDTVSYQKEHQERMNQDPLVQPLNRYCDILPYNDTRVILQERKGLSPTDCYINANFIHSPLGEDQRIIAAQGPKPNTVDHFWRMVVEQNVTLIVSVCRLSEGGRTKCHKYWPNGGSDTDPDFKNLVNGMRIKTLETKKIGDTLEERIFEITMEDGKQHRVLQVHYTGWPDHEVPSGPSINEFSHMLKIFIDVLLNTDKTHKVVVHCSAGVGRTGTTIALVHLMINISSQINKGVADPEFSIFSTVRRMREQRFLLVQMPDQYTFIYQFLSLWLKTEVLKKQ